MRILLKDGSRLLGLNLGQSLAYRADTVMLSALSSQHQVGLYAVAVTPASILRLPSTAVGQVAFHQAAAGDAGLRQILARLAKLTGILIPLAVCGWLLADWVIPFMYGAEYRDAVGAFRILLVAEIALAPFLVLSRTMAGSGNTWGASAAGLMGVAALVTSGAVLIPGQGAEGAAWASVIAYSAMSATACLALWIGVRTSRRRA
jgi:O-antigen/teichoic acid export membrane protein